MTADPNAKRRSSFARADRLKKEAAKTVEQKAEQQKAADAKKVEQQRKAEAKKDADRKAEQKREAAAKQEAQNRANARRDEARAAAYVAERQKAQQADAIAEQRRQTSMLRTRHREETRSLQRNESAALDRHWHAIKRIDGAEQRALHEFDVKRGSIKGRASELVKGKKHFDREREKIAERHEADRMKQHRDLEALKERQAKIAQETRLRQVHERKAIFDKNRDERRDLAKTQEADRPRLIEDRKQAFAKAAELAQTQKQERTQERGQGPKLSM